LHALNVTANCLKRRKIELNIMESSSQVVECYPTEEDINISLSQMFTQNSTHQHTIYKKTTLMLLLLMESDGGTNCLQKLLHVARTVGIFFAKL